MKYYLCTYELPLKNEEANIHLREAELVINGVQIVDEKIYQNFQDKVREYFSFDELEMLELYLTNELRFWVSEQELQEKVIFTELNDDEYQFLTKVIKEPNLDFVRLVIQEIPNELDLYFEEYGER